MTRGLVLCGGQSQRLGRPKYLECVHNLPLYLHWSYTLQRLNIPPFLSLNHQQPIPPGGIPIIRDAAAMAGPLSGIVAAFRQFPNDEWLVVACDLVYASESNLRQLLEVDFNQCDAVAFENPEQNLPFALLTLYTPRAHPILEEEFKTERKSALSALMKMNTHIVPLEDGLTVKGINTESDVQNWRAYLRL